MSQLWMARPSKRAVAGKRSLGRVSCLTAKHRAAPTGGLLGRATRRFNRFAALAKQERAELWPLILFGTAWGLPTHSVGGEDTIGRIGLDGDALLTALIFGGP